MTVDVDASNMFNSFEHRVDHDEDASTTNSGAVKKSHDNRNRESFLETSSCQKVIVLFNSGFCQFYNKEVKAVQCSPCDSTTAEKAA